MYLPNDIFISNYIEDKTHLVMFVL